METSRQKLFEFIRIHRAVTIPEISQALQMTPANARHHLKILQTQGLIEVAGTQKNSIRGHPSKIYKLTECVIGNNIETLTSAIFTELRNLKGQDHDNFLKNIAQKITHHNYQYHDTTTNLSKRLFSTIQQLNKMNYFARWEAHAVSPRVILGNCPYKSIINENPELCTVDKFILEELLDSKVEQTVKLGLDTKGLRQCIFSIQNISERKIHTHSPLT